MGPKWMMDITEGDKPCNLQTYVGYKWSFWSLIMPIYLLFLAVNVFF